MLDETWIDDLANNGEWWHESSRETIAKTFKELIDLGVSQEQAQSIIEAVAGAMRSEYGD